MSMLSSQIDELRQMADGGATYRDAREAMLRAADTIWELRDDLQRANAENAKLRKERDYLLMNSNPTATELRRVRSAWKKDRDENDRLKSENAKLREEVEQWHRLTAGIELPDYPITEFKPKDLERENAKLRELVADMFAMCTSDCLECEHGYDNGSCRLYDRMRELGVEVEP